MNSKIVGFVVLLILSTASISHGTDWCQELVNKGEYDKALDVCTGMINSPRPQPHQTYYNRGLAYSKKGQHDKAIADYTKAIQVGPPNERVYQARAAAYESIEEYDKAVWDLDKAVALAPGEHSYLNRARFYRNRGKYDEAIADCGSVIQSDPVKSSAYLFRSGVYYEKGAFEDSVRDYRKLIALFVAANPEVKLDLLYVRLLDSSWKVSKDEYDKVLAELRSYVLSHDVSSDDEKWWRTISKYYLGMGGLTDAKLIEEARNGRNEKAVEQRLCDAYYSIGEKKLLEKDRQGAREFFNKSIDTKASSYSARYSKAMLRLMDQKML